MKEGMTFLIVILPKTKDDEHKVNNNYIVIAKDIAKEEDLLDAEQINEDITCDKLQVIMIDYMLTIRFRDLEKLQDEITSWLRYR